MNLRELATDDLNVIMSTDFGWIITIIDPADIFADITGYSNDISQVIDPDTGQIVSGRLATIAVPLRALANEGLSIPENIEDATKKPWRVLFKDTANNDYTFKVISSNPDRALGIVTCELEIYDAS
jgi:hypothetical protein